MAEHRLLEGRNGEIYRRHAIYRWTMARIAEEYGISIARVSEICATVRNKISPHDLSEFRQRSLEMYDEVASRAMEIADMLPAPVTVGKDGLPLQDPETGEWVRDYSGRLTALSTAMKADGEIRKLMGLDAASKTEVSGGVAYSIESIDPEVDLK